MPSHRHAAVLLSSSKLVVALEENGGSDGVLVIDMPGLSTDDLGDRLVEALADIKGLLQGRKARVVLERDLYVSRVLVLPLAGSAHELDGLVENCVEPYLVGDLTQYVLSWRLLGSVDRYGTFLVTCVKEGLLESLARGCAALNCDVETFTTDRAVIEAALLPKPTPGGTRNEAVLLAGEYWTYVHAVGGNLLASLSFPAAAEPSGVDYSDGPEDREGSSKRIFSRLTAGLVEEGVSAVPEEVRVLGPQADLAAALLPAVYERLFDVQPGLVHTEQDDGHGRRREILAAALGAAGELEVFDRACRIARPLSRKAWHRQLNLAGLFLSALVLMGAVGLLRSARRDSGLQREYASRIAMAWTGLYPEEQMPVDVVERLASEAMLCEGRLESLTDSARRVCALDVLERTIGGLPEHVPCQIERITIDQTGAVFACVTEGFSDAGRIAQAIDKREGVTAEARDIKRLETGPPEVRIAFDLRVAYER